MRHKLWHGFTTNHIKYDVWQKLKSTNNDINY